MDYGSCICVLFSMYFSFLAKKCTSASTPLFTDNDGHVFFSRFLHAGPLRNALQNGDFFLNEQKCESSSPLFSEERASI